MGAEGEGEEERETNGVLASSGGGALKSPSLARCGRGELAKLLRAEALLRKECLSPAGGGG